METEERAFEVREDLYEKVHDLVDRVLAVETPEVQELVRTQLTESFRFWKRNDKRKRN